MRTLRVLKTSTLSVVSAITLSIRSGCLSLTDRAPESSLRLSQWTPVPRWLLSGLHANYCNQTQVFLILHLTHLLTAVSWVFLPLQTSLNHAPLATPIIIQYGLTLTNYVFRWLISRSNKIVFIINMAIISKLCPNLNSIDHLSHVRLEDHPVIYDHVNYCAFSSQIHTRIFFLKTNKQTNCWFNDLELNWALTGKSSQNIFGNVFLIMLICYINLSNELLEQFSAELTFHCSSQSHRSNVHLQLLKWNMDV